MPRYLFLSISCLLVAMTITLKAQQSRNVHIVVKDPESGQDIQAYHDSWAILIGIDKYWTARGLDYAAADAISMKQLLQEKFGFPEKNIFLITDEKATQENIKRMFGGLYKSHPDDRVVIFFAGHGETIDLTSGGQMGFLIPVDGKVKGAADLYSTCISMQTLKELSDFIPAKHMLFLVDACYGGLAATGTRSMSKETKGYIRKVTAARTRQILTAGGRGEQVIERSEWGHSAFTYKLLDGLGRGLADLDNDGLIRSSELASYMQVRVSTITGNMQTPQFRSFSEDEGEFLFILPEPQAAVEKGPSPEIKTGDLFVKSSPDGARISVDGQVTNFATPDLVPSIAAGEHLIEITLAGASQSKKVTILPGQINRVEFSLLTAEQSSPTEQTLPSLRSTLPVPGRWRLEGGYAGSADFGPGWMIIGQRSLTLSDRLDLNLSLGFSSHSKDWDIGTTKTTHFQIASGIQYWLASSGSVIPAIVGSLLFTQHSSTFEGSVSGFSFFGSTNGSLLGLQGGFVAFFPLDETKALGISSAYQAIDLLRTKSTSSWEQFVVTVNFAFGL